MLQICFGLLLHSLPSIVHLLPGVGIELVSRNHVRAIVVSAGVQPENGSKSSFGFRGSGGFYGSDAWHNIQERQEQAEGDLSMIDVLSILAKDISVPGGVV